MSYRGSFDSENDSDSGSTTNTFYRRSRSRSPIKRNSQILKISNNQTFNMALPVSKQEYLNIIPDFYSETSLLPRFLEISEKLVKFTKQDVSDF